LEKEHWQNIETGDQNAYSEVYIFYYKRLYNYGRKFTPDTAMIEDAINDVFIMVWKNRQRLSAINSPQSYLFSSFRNSLFKKLALQQKKFAHSISGEPEEIEFSIESIIIERETDDHLRERIEKALTTLTSRQREAIFLRFYEGVSYAEIATIMNVSVKASYKIMARALAELKDALGISLLALLSFFAKNTL
jgi:RNA polymerase sigma factor (sigma-70 family)